MSAQPRPRLPEHERLLIKADLAALINRAGGLKAAAHATGLSMEMLSRCARADDADMISIDALGLIERFVGDPVASSTLAALARRPAVCGGEFSAADVASLATESGAAIAEAARALGDNVVTPSEAQRLMRALDDLHAAVSAMRRKLAKRLKARAA